jgi:hypothetical protein
MNQYKYSVLPNLRWGIFFHDRLLATVASQSEAKRILRYLQGRSTETQFTPPASAPIGKRAKTAKRTKTDRSHPPKDTKQAPKDTKQVCSNIVSRSIATKRVAD